MSSKKKLKITQESIINYRNRLKENTSYIKFLKACLLVGMNSSRLNSTAKLSSSYMEGAIFAVEGWVPKTQLYRLFPLLKGLGVHAEETILIKGERIPTCMENKGYGKNGEDLVHIYDAPAFQDKDPSSWVFWAFAFFLCHHHIRCWLWSDLSNSFSFSKKEIFEVKACCKKVF